MGKVETISVKWDMKTEGTQNVDKMIKKLKELRTELSLHKKELKSISSTPWTDSSLIAASEKRIAATKKEIASTRSQIKTNKKKADQNDVMVTKTERSTSGWLGQDLTIRKYTGTLDKVTGKVKNYKLVQEDTTKGAKQFKFEYLGVMFAGMALANTMQQLTSGAMDWLGVTDYMSTSINVLMTESMIPYVDILYGAGDAFLSLATSTDAAAVVFRDFLGATALVGQGIGVVMQVFGSVMLGLLSLIQVFPEMKSVAAPAIGSISTAFGILLGNMSDAPPFLKLIASTFASIGAGIASIPLANALGDLPVVGDVLQTIVPAGAAAGAFVAAGGVNNVFDVLSQSADKARGASIVTKKEVDDVSNSISGAIFGMQTFNDSKAKPTVDTASIDDANSKLDEVIKKMYAIQNFGKPATSSSGAVSASFSSGMSGQVTISKVPGATGYTLSRTPNSYTGGQMTSIPGLDFNVPYAPSTGFASTEWSKNAQVALGKTYNTATGMWEGDTGGIVPGRFGEPVPIIAHGGERFEGINGSSMESSSITYAPVYNVSVSDKSEFERMMREHDNMILNDFKRQYGG